VDEDRLLRLIDDALGGGSALTEGVVAGPGDDCAVLRVGGQTLLATVDLLVEDVHFTLAGLDWGLLGEKSLAVSLSDIAAMGGEPRWAMVGLGLPPAPESADNVRALYAGIREGGDHYGCRVVGGDLVRSPRVTLSVTALGTMPPDLQPVLRSGAHAGEVLAVTGELGAAAAGLDLLRDPRAREELQTGPSTDAYLAELALRSQRRPVPRITAGTLLARAGATAMMDLSDGLATDLPRLARASGVKLVVDVDLVPVSLAARVVAGVTSPDDDEAGLAYALGGGEDYELAVTLPSEAFGQAQEELMRADGLPLTAIGRVDSAPGPAEAVFEREEQPHIARPHWRHFEVD